jgi:methylated-DNA-protein-cysteine methyltransferase-like protein
MAADFAERVVAGVGRLQPGEVASYGDIAAEAGYPGAARGVGRVLARHDGPIPWWRVVMSNGTLAPGKEEDQGRRLRAEGVAVDGNRVRRPDRLTPKDR